MRLYLSLLCFLLLAAPALGQQVVNGTITVSGRATESDPEDTGLTGNMSFYFGAEWIGDSAPAPDGVLTWDGSIAWDTTTVAEGPGTLTARMTDLAGNEGTSTGVVVDVDNAPDNTPPVLTILEP